MTFQIGAAIHLDIIGAMKLIVGTTVEVFNALARLRMQPTSLVYAANCSIIAGDSTGWRTSIELLAKRSEQGFRLGELAIGFPGKHLMKYMITHEYGPRWLGILAVSSLISRERFGGGAMYHILTCVANDRTSSFHCDKEQADAMWITGREIFLDTAVQREFLQIVAECSNVDPNFTHNSKYSCRDCSPEDLGDAILAALKLWEFSALRPECDLRARGVVGSGLLILYLTVVCGFSVTVQLGAKNLHFGPTNETKEIFVTIDNRQAGWVVGYTYEGSGESVVQRSLNPEVAKHNSVCRYGAASFAPARSSIYLVQDPMEKDKLAPGLVNLRNLVALSEKLMNTAHARSGISSWLKAYLHHIFTATQLVGNIPSEGDEKYPLQTTLKTHSKGIAERLRAAFDVWMSSIIDARDVNELIHKLEENDLPSDVMINDLSKKLTKGDVSILCSCVDHGGTLPPGRCEIQDIQQTLEEFAWKLWIGAHATDDAQRILRDLGPNSFWHVLQVLDIESGTFQFPSFITTETLINCIGTRVGGYTYRCKRDGTLGVAVSGTVIGLMFNMTQPIHLDAGHSVYIVPGCMETPMRRISDVVEEVSQGRALLGRVPDVIRLSEIRRPKDVFGNAEVQYVIQEDRAIAMLTTSVRIGETSIDMSMIDAIDNSSRLQIVDSCLGECASGRLTEDEIGQVEIMASHNYRDLGLNLNPAKISLVLAHNNTAVQRAVVSHHPSDCWLQLGSCVHCAVRILLAHPGPHILIDGVSSQENSIKS